MPSDTSAFSGTMVPNVFFESPFRAADSGQLQPFTQGLQFGHSFHEFAIDLLPASLVKNEHETTPSISHHSLLGYFDIDKHVRRARQINNP